jgi:hypothetical protein
MRHLMANKDGVCRVLGAISSGKNVCLISKKVKKHKPLNFIRKIDEV